MRTTSKNSTEKRSNTKNHRAPFKIFGVELIYLLFIGIGFAALGWTVENIARFIINGTIDSRFHILPFISPYGLIPIAFHLALGSPNDLCVFGKKVFEVHNTKNKVLSNLTALLLIYLLVFFGELAVGNAWDCLFGVKLWNYSNMPLHVTQYTGVISTLGFGTGAYLIFKFAYFPILDLVRKRVSLRTAKIIVFTLGTLIVLDTLRMMLMIIIFNEAPQFWKIKLR